MSFGPLALIVAAGLIGPLLASAHRFGPPMIVGEIAAGVVIGVSGFGWIEPNDPLLTGLSAIGFALLMFIVGTHLPVRDQRLRSALARGGAVAATVGLLAAVAAALLASSVGLDRPAVLAVLLATSSGAVALPVLQELGPPDRPALVTIAWIAIADVVTVLALPVVLATGGMWRVVTGGALVVLAGVGMLVLAQLLRNRPWIQRMRTLSRDRGWGLDLRVSLLALFTCAWIAHRFGSSVLIAGFVVGMVVALLGEPRRVAAATGRDRRRLCDPPVLRPPRNPDRSRCPDGFSALAGPGRSAGRRFDRHPSRRRAGLAAAAIDGAGGVGPTRRTCGRGVDRAGHEPAHCRPGGGSDGVVAGHVGCLRARWQRCSVRAER